MSDKFVKWDLGYHTDYTYEVKLVTGKLVKCYGKGGYMWAFGSQDRYSQGEIEGIRVLNKGEFG